MERGWEWGGDAASPQRASVSEQKDELGHRGSGEPACRRQADPGGRRAWTVRLPEALLGSFGNCLFLVFFPQTPRSRVSLK